jgi:ribosomal protein L40E
MKKFGFAVLLVVAFSIMSGILAALLGGDVERATSSAVTIGASAALLYLGIKALRRDLGNKTASGKAIPRGPGVDKVSPRVPPGGPRRRTTIAGSSEAEAATGSVDSADVPEVQDSRNVGQPQQPRDPAVAAAAAVCTQCGARNPDDAKFCCGCGELLSKQGRAEAGDPAAPPTEGSLAGSPRSAQQGGRVLGGGGRAAAKGQLWSREDTAVLVAIVMGLLIIAAVWLKASWRGGDAPPIAGAGTDVGSARASASSSDTPVGLSGSASKTGSQSSTAPARTVGNACPYAIPAGVKPSLLSDEESKRVVGTDGSLESRPSDAAEESLTNLLMWNAELRFSNGGAYCVSSAEVQLTLRQGGSSFTERHAVSFDPILYPGQARACCEEAHLQHRTKEYGEPLVLEGWRVTRVWGFHPTAP